MTIDFLDTLSEVTQSNGKVIDTEAKSIPLAHSHHHRLSWLGHTVITIDFPGLVTQPSP
jgi:hypothetical protein